MALWGLFGGRALVESQSDPNLYSSLVTVRVKELRSEVNLRVSVKRRLSRNEVVPAIR